MALHDGAHIHVPRLGEVLPTPTPYGLGADGRIDINLADAALLEILPGIGPAIAQPVIEHREMKGLFETIEHFRQAMGGNRTSGIMDVGESRPRVCRSDLLGPGKRLFCRLNRPTTACPLRQVCGGARREHCVY